MDTRPIRPHPLLPPLLIGIISLLGICVILASAFLPQQDAESVPTRTSTPFQYAFLATETMIPTPPTETAESTEFLFVPAATSDIEDPGGETTPFFVSTEQNETSPDYSFTPGPTAILDPIFGNSEPLTAGKYDDSDSGFTYIGAWNPEANTDTYQETIFVSDGVGDYVAFSFIGYQMDLGYQSREDAGEFTVNIDGLESTVTQQVGSVWISEQFVPGTHYVIITHTGEGPVSLDYIEISE